MKRTFYIPDQLKEIAPVIEFQADSFHIGMSPFEKPDYLKFKLNPEEWIKMNAGWDNFPMENLHRWDGNGKPTLNLIFVDYDSQKTAIFRYVEVPLANALLFCKNVNSLGSHLVHTVCSENVIKVVEFLIRNPDSIDSSQIDSMPNLSTQEWVQFCQVIKELGIHIGELDEDGSKAAEAEKDFQEWTEKFDRMKKSIEKSIENHLID